MAVAWLVAGLCMLLVGGELFVRGASGFARVVGLSPLVIGLTVVAFGTSAPELGVSMGAALADKPGLALANVAGSNAFNILVILGLSALVAPLAVQSQLVRLDVPVMVASSLVLLLLALNGTIERWEGAALFLLALLYTAWLIRAGLRENHAAGGRPPWRWSQGGLAALWIAIGLAALVFGSHWTVQGATAVAERLGISPRIIGLTIVAAGTSLPELATSVMATIRGERDIAVGNVVGSNIFNVLVILGLSAAAAPNGLAVSAPILRIDLPMVLLVALLCLPVFILRRTISRPVGLFFLLVYVAYLGWVLYR